MAWNAQQRACRNEDKRKKFGEQGCQRRRGLLQLLLQIKGECMCLICVAALRNQIWTATWGKAHMACHTKHAEGLCGQQCYPSGALMPGLAEEGGPEIKALQQCEEGAG